VAIIQTSKKICAQIKAIERARSLSSDVITQNVSQLDGNVTTMMIVEMDPTKENAKITHVQQTNSNAKVDTVSKKSLNVTGIVTAWIFLMKWIVLLGIQMESIVQRISLNVITTFACDKMTYVMEQMIVTMGQMKRKNCAETFLVTNCLNSNAATSNAFPISLFVTVKMIVGMEQMRTT
jgi:hypothetical protein